jgi:hypothetical protein
MNMLYYALALVLFSTVTPEARAVEPWAVVSGQSVVEVRSALRHIYQRLGRKDLVAALDSAAVTNLVTGNLKGLGLNRPLGCMVVPNPQGEGVILTFVPMTNEVDFREFLGRHGLRLEPSQEGVMPLQIPIVGRVYLRFEKDYAWFGLSAESLRQPLPIVGQILPPKHQASCLAATIYLERMPEQQRQLWLQRGERGVGWLFQDRRESVASFAEAAGLSLSGLLFHHLATDARELTLQAHVDRKKDLLWVQVEAVPRPHVRWMQEVQARAEKPLVVNIPIQTWAKMLGAQEAAANRAAQVFTAPEKEQLKLSVAGGEALSMRAELSGAALAYHAALEKEGIPKDKKPRKTRAERRREREERRLIPPG